MPKRWLSQPLDKHEPNWYNTPMTKTQHTACYSIDGQIDLTRLQEEARILVGVDAANIQYLEDVDVTHFTLTDEVDDGIDPDAHFDWIGRDFSRFLPAKVTLNEIFVDN